jgi:citrate lyase beta subunit
MLIPPDTRVAAALGACGVDRAFVDLETLGKAERQGHVSAHFSHHRLEDVGAYREATRGVELMVRTNPLHEGSREELERVLAHGPDVVMLPMFRHPREVERYLRLVAGRARVNLLVETPQAAVRLREILAVGPIDEVHVGLNDLHLALGLDFMFELLAGGVVDLLAQACREAGVPMGIGGVARVDEGAVPGRMVLGEHVRLGSSGVILSRTFTRRSASSEVVDPEELAAEVARLRAAEAAWRRASREELLDNRDALRRSVREVAFGTRETVA